MSESAITGESLSWRRPDHKSLVQRVIVDPAFALLSIFGQRRVQRGILSLLILMIPFPLDFHVWYRADAAEYGALGGLELSVTTVLIPILYMPLLISLRGRKIHISAALGIYVILAGLSFFYAKDGMLSIYEIALFFQMFLMYIYLVNAINNVSDLLLVVKMLVLGLLLEGLVMIAVAGKGAPISLPGIETRLDVESVGDFGRVGGSIGSPNDAAAYLSMCVALTAAYLFVPASKAVRLMRGVALGCGVAALVLTLSRGGWMACGISVALILFLARRYYRVRRGALVTGLVLAIAIGAWVYEPVAARLMEDDKGAAESRVPLMQIASLMIEADGILGVGANNFAIAMEQYVTQGFAGRFIYSVHNRFLLIWCETGIGSLLAYLCFLFAAMWAGFRCWRTGHGIAAPIALGCFAAIAGHMSHMMVDPFRGFTVTQLLWVLAALAHVSFRLSREKAINHESRYSIV
jgi:putative inorganic carbon (hco3(-)) transporter